MGGDAAEPVERKAGSPAHEPLEWRAAQLPAASHVTGSGDHVGAPAGEGDHGVYDVWLVGAVGHRDEHIGSAGGGNPRLHRVEHAATEVVAKATDGGQVRVEALDDGDGGILVEVVDDKDLVGRGDRRRQRPQDGVDRLALLEHGDDDGELREDPCLGHVVDARGGVRTTDAAWARPET